MHVLNISRILVTVIFMVLGIRTFPLIILDCISLSWLKSYIALCNKSTLLLFIYFLNFFKNWSIGLGNQETGINIYTLPHIEQLTNKDFLYSKGSSTQYFVMTYMGKDSEEECAYICIHNCAVHLKLTWHYKSTIRQLKITNEWMNTRY